MSAKHIDIVHSLPRLPDLKMPFMLSVLRILYYSVDIELRLLELLLGAMTIWLIRLNCLRLAVDLSIIIDFMN